MQYLPLRINSTFSKLAMDIPNSLELISSQDTVFIGGLLFTGLLLLALSRMFESHYLKGIIVNYFTLSISANIQKADLRLTSTSSILLILNYFISSWICLLLFSRTLFDDSSSMMILITGGVAFVILAYQFVGIGLTAWITGEPEYFKEQAIQFLSGFQFAGIIYFLLGLIWFLNPEIKAELFYIFVGILLTIFAVRILKGIVISLFQGISWYYIILYFCTLEILPLLVTYYYVELNFNL